ncbi:hypothetical protein F4824DRAFT_474012 [Ustulina deusta]|nr:hypothetical protein F4824DRAFT_474012 [Ustulina deusta]
MMYYNIYPIHSGNGLQFTDWVTLLTLCFAPLVAHIVAGAPRPSYIYNKRPDWHERICHYNPTSIMWRYFSILDRRLRTRTWSPLDLAATNALFWTERGWDGSDQMITRSLPHCTYIPSHARAEIFSDETFKSVVTALQGIQALYLFIAAFLPTHGSDFYSLGADQIFFPLSVLGLLRLLAAPWLSRDYRYTSRVDVNATLASKFNEPDEADDNRLSLESLIQFPAAKAITQDHYRQVSCWRSRLFRALYMTTLLGIWSMTLLWIFPIPLSDKEFEKEFTITSFSAAIFYLILLAVSVSVHAYYFITGQITSTIIPCASHLWYKIYTVILFVFMTVILIVSLSETTKTVCGKYTSLPVADADLTCWTKDAGVATSDPKSNLSNVFALALKYPYAVEGTVLEEGDFWVANFSGNCLGHLSSELRVRARALDVVNFTGLIDWGNGTVTEDV